MKNSLPEAPKHLSPAARAWWRRILDQWALDDSALLILQVGLEAYDRMVEAQALVKQHGIVAPDRFGQLKTNPAVAVERDARAGMLATFRHLGLNLEPISEPGRPPGK